jgi:hypothetical protein
MCRRLHKTNYANIILFLTHHSKDNFILEEISKVAQGQFSEFDIVKFDKDVDAVNNLIQNIPEMTLEDKSVEEHRLEQYQTQDEFNELKQPKNNPIELSDDESDDEDIDLVSKLNNSFKTLEILGQILKNHYASIKAPQKIKFTEESYFLGLRTLNSFYKAFEESNEFVVNQINEYFEEKSKKNRKIGNFELEVLKRQEVGRIIVFNMASFVTYNFIKKITSCIGTDKLKEIYPDVLKKNPDNSIKIINFAIQLEYFKGFPMSELKTILNELKTNPLAYSIVRKTVVDYLYMYPLSIEKKQQIGNTLSIKMNTMRRIEQKSVVKKK